MANSSDRSGGPDDNALLALFRAIAANDPVDVAQRLAASPDLPGRAIRTGASRQDSGAYFLTSIGHYVYEGDTALHFAAAGYQRRLAETLVANGAGPRARNRRGAEPLHYAADGSPDAEHWNPAAQSAVIEYLITAGADPNARDKSGVAPLHRAVRCRCSAAVRALIENGADPRLPNKSGSTALHLAVQNTGRSDSGSDGARDEQRRVIGILLEHGARATDVDGKGKTVVAAASSDWIRQLLETT